MTFHLVVPNVVKNVSLFPLSGCLSIAVLNYTLPVLTSSDC